MIQHLKKLLFGDYIIPTIDFFKKRLDVTVTYLHYNKNVYRIYLINILLQHSFCLGFFM